MKGSSYREGLHGGMYRMTLATSVRREGLGLHCGEPGAVTLRPGSWGSGLVVCVDEHRAPIGPDVVGAGEGSARIEVAGSRVRTPEHLLAALAGLGVTDCEIHVEGPEVPALDGSSAQWVDAVDEAGRQRGPRLEAPELPRLEVVAAGGWASASPGPDRLAVEVDFGRGGPAGSLEVARTEVVFREEVAFARTFVRAADVPRLRAAGRGRGATPENTVVWPSSTLRSPDEPVRHKLLDAWGDLSVLGPFRGRILVVRGSHALHHALVRAISAAFGR